MTSRTFMNRVANGRFDVVQFLLDLLKKTESRYCVIGGLAVNAYAEPVVSLDMDLVVVTDKLEVLCDRACSEGMKIETFEHSINLSVAGSDLRVQLQTDSRYQDFISRAVRRQVLGYEMSVAALEDVLQGKIWAYSDERRRRSIRQKDLADILRLVERYPDLGKKVPPEIQLRLP